MRGKAAKEIRKHLKETQPNLLKEENKALYKRVYRRVKEEFKATPWNKKNEIIVN